MQTPLAIEYSEERAAEIMPQDAGRLLNSSRSGRSTQSADLDKRGARQRSEVRPTIH